LHYPVLLHAVLCHIMPCPSNSLVCMLVCPFWVLGSSSKSCGVCDLTLRQAMMDAETDQYRQERTDTIKTT
jgi:hypothetical protein